ncbi:MAG: hypothetical protein E6K43_07880 [Gammaproteobacteria bacterium]|nr:MAG: hypothetical protein E6K43_07880 [Gammaproteobacteria bacterium]
MRDAAAKFLVQFPQQPAGQQLAREEPLSVQSGVDTAANVLIEAVPIEEAGAQEEAAAPPTPPPAAAPGAVPAKPPASPADPPKPPGA